MKTLSPPPPLPSSHFNDEKKRCVLVWAQTHHWCGRRGVLFNFSFYTSHSSCGSGNKFHEEEKRQGNPSRKPRILYYKKDTEKYNFEHHRIIFGKTEERFACSEATRLFHTYTLIPCIWSSTYLFDKQKSSPKPFCMALKVSREGQSALSFLKSFVPTNELYRIEVCQGLLKENDDLFGIHKYSSEMFSLLKLRNRVNEISVSRNNEIINSSRCFWNWPRRALC